MGNDEREPEQVTGRLIKFKPRHWCKVPGCVLQLGHLGLHRTADGQAIMTGVQ